jgi:predicted ATP-dependent protease
MFKVPKPLSYKHLRIKLEPQQLKFKTTKELQTLHQLIGQERAIAAFIFGIGIKSHGYNIFAMGPTGIGKLELISKILISDARKLPVPNDWIYIHNFTDPLKAVALPLPAGVGHQFQHDMNILVDELAANISAVFESDDYQKRMKRISDTFEKQQNSSLSGNNKSKYTGMHHLYKIKHEKEKLLQLNLTKSAIAPHINTVRKKYCKFPQLVKYLINVQDDIIKHVNDFVKQDDKTNVVTFMLEHPGITRYRVNLFVDNKQLKGAPVIFEENPNYSNLICRIEHVSEQGNLATNFLLIKPGALHRANGGYLIIEARKLKKHKEAWEALKNALFSNQVRIEPVDTQESIKPVSLEPMPIPLSVKVILIGERDIYYSLSQKDDDFPELFKAAVDFDELIERNNRNIQLYARLIGTMIARKKLPPFHASAVAEIIEHSSRLAEDNQKLSTHISAIEDLIVESAYWASHENNKIVYAHDIKTALASQVHRMDRARELYHEDINRGFIIIKVDGKTVGQINCLSVRRIGNFAYGHPTRITARVRFGKSKFIDIQREIKLAGPMHAKAGLIISNFLASRFDPEHVYSMSASIAFEQVYVWTDGDSASVGELCALLSAIARIPMHQYLAVTGSIDQYGRVQAVGSLNEKIEGFFDICAAKGLNGKQGVLIPAVNVKNLMLREDIVQAAKKGLFFIYPIKSVDQAVTLLTGMPAGKRNKDGRFPINTVYYYVEENLRKYASKLKKYPKQSELS